MERNKFILTLLLVVFLSVFITQWVFYSMFIVDVKEADMYVTVVASSKVVGMDIATDALRFSTVPAGREVTRYVNVTSDSDSKVIIKASGSMKDWIYADSGFILKAGETKTVDILLIIPEGTKEGDYKGKLKFLFTRA